METLCKYFLVCLILATCAVGQQTTTSPNSASPASGKASAKAKPEHSAAEILGWIASNSLTQAGNGAAGPREHVVLLNSQVWATDPSNGCSISTHMDRTDFVPDGAHMHTSWMSINVAVPVAKLDPDKVEITSETVPLMTVYKLTFETTNKLPDLRETFSGVLYNPSPRSFEDAAKDDGYPKDGVASAAYIFFTNEDMATRMKKAFGDLIRQCGGKPSAKDIY